MFDDPVRRLPFLGAAFFVPQFVTNYTETRNTGISRRTQCGFDYSATVKFKNWVATSHLHLRGRCYHSFIINNVQWNEYGSCWIVQLQININSMSRNSTTWINTLKIPPLLGIKLTMSARWSVQNALDRCGHCRFNSQRRRYFKIFIPGAEFLFTLQSTHDWINVNL